MTTLDETESPAAQERSPLPAAPVSAAGAARLGFLLALSVIAVGVVAVRDAVVAAGWLPGRQWIPAVARVVDGLEPGPWMAPVAIGVGVLGLLVIAVAVAPRRRTAVALTAESAVFLRRADVATIAATAAGEVPGVVRVRARAGRSRVVVRCAVTSSTDEVGTAVSSAVHTELSVLQRVPRIVVRMKEMR